MRGLRFVQTRCRCAPRINPLGGPTSSAWATRSGRSSNRGRSQCVSPLFAQCFVGCDAPGNCGWNIATPPGTVSFDGLRMFEGSFGTDPEGLAFHPISGAPTVGVTLRFRFSEIAGAPTVNMAYIVGITDSSGEANPLVFLRGDGLVVVFRGALGYFGTWGPAGNGAVHVVHLTIDGSGNPVLFIDGVAITLTGPGAVSPIVDVPNQVGASIINDDLSGQGYYDRIFVANGIYPPSEEFCCPGGTPS